MNATEFCHRAGLNGLETKIIEAVCAKDYDAARISIEMLEALNVGPTRKSWIAANRLSSACFTLAHGSRVPLKALTEALKLDAKQVLAVECIIRYHSTLENGELTGAIEYVRYNGESK